jgi:hypothetical protein
MKNIAEGIFNLVDLFDLFFVFVVVGLPREALSHSGSSST